MSKQGIQHVIGIGGVGMSALAQALLDHGYRVTGSDRQIRSPEQIPAGVLSALAYQGVHLSCDDASLITSDVSRIIVTTAIEETNPALMCARMRGIPVVHRATALAELLKPYHLIGVAGTCGKSTTTAILGHLLAVANCDPVVVNGAQIIGWNENGTRVGSTRRGHGKFAVIEIDESDKSLFSFHPQDALITNASADHYSKEEMNAVFDAFRKNVSGVCMDARETKIVPSSLAQKIPLLGTHNQMNAELAVRMARVLGLDDATIERGLRSFPGVERRLEKVGVSASGLVVYDDYAHNPAKLAALLTTLRETHPQGLGIIWRPHGFTPLRKMSDALIQMFRTQVRPGRDHLLILSVYDAGGTTDRSYTSHDFVNALGGGAQACTDEAEAMKLMSTYKNELSALVVCGARDPHLPYFARQLLCL